MSREGEKNSLKKPLDENQPGFPNLRNGFSDCFARALSFNDAASSSSSNQFPAWSFNRPKIGAATYAMDENQPSVSSSDAQSRSFAHRYSRASSFNDSASSSNSNLLRDLILYRSLEQLHIGGNNNSSYDQQRTVARTMSGEYSHSNILGDSRNLGQTSQSLRSMCQSPNINGGRGNGVASEIYNGERELVFSGVIKHVVELSMDPSGTHTVKRLLDVCTPEQEWQIVSAMINNPGHLIRMCSNMHGKSVVQNLIETPKDWTNIPDLIKALEPSVPYLINHVNGNHVIRSCLKYYSSTVNTFIFEAAITHCYNISTDKHGCLTMQSIIDHSSGPYQQLLLEKVSKLAYILASDPCGNYIVQHVIDRENPTANAMLTSCLTGHFVRISTSKGGSHVVEKCISKIPVSHPIIIRELLSTDDDDFLGLLQHDYANYVVQSALKNAKNGLYHDLLVRRVCAHVHSLKGTPQYSRIVVALSKGVGKHPTRFPAQYGV